jgi:hypothetical protein
VAVWDVDIHSDDHVNYNKYIYILVLEYYRWSGKPSMPDEDRGNSFHGGLAQASNSAVTASLKGAFV